MFVGGLMPYLCYLCLLPYSGVQQILCCVYVLFVFVLTTLWYQLLLIVYFWLPLRYSLMFIYDTLFEFDTPAHYLLVCLNPVERCLITKDSCNIGFIQKVALTSIYNTPKCFFSDTPSPFVPHLQNSCMIIFFYWEDIYQWMWILILVCSWGKCIFMKFLFKHYSRWISVTDFFRSNPRSVVSFCTDNGYSRYFTK